MQEVRTSRTHKIEKDMTSEVHNIDCLEYMRTLPDNYFQLAIADPPYGIDIASHPFRNKQTQKEWDKTTPMDEFFAELFRVSQEQMIWGGNYFGLPPNKHFIIWDKKQPFDFTSSMCEYCWSSLDKPAKMFSYNVGNELGKIHPTQKPVALYAWMLQKFAQEGWRIFDPMMGSQSSRIAAYKLGFDYVGCELDKEYFDKGCERFDRECHGIYVNADGSKVQQQTLF